MQTLKWSSRTIFILPLRNSETLKCVSSFSIIFISIWAICPENYRVMSYGIRQQKTPANLFGGERGLAGTQRSDVPYSEFFVALYSEKSPEISRNNLFPSTYSIYLFSQSITNPRHSGCLWVGSWDDSFLYRKLYRKKCKTDGMYDITRKQEESCLPLLLITKWMLFAMLLSQETNGNWNYWVCYICGVIGYYSKLQRFLSTNQMTSDFSTTSDDPHQLQQYAIITRRTLASPLK